MKKLRLTPAMMLGGGVVLSLVIAAFVVMLVSITNQRDTSEQVTGADQRIALANELERRIIDVETGARGFVITGQRRFLQPRSDALRALPDLKSDLIKRERAGGATSQVAQLRMIYAQLGRYIHRYSNPLIATGSHDLGSARATIETGEGKRQIDALRSAIEVFVAQESATAQTRSADADRSASIAVALAIAGLFLVPLFVIALVTFISRTVADPVRETAKAAQRMRGGDLAVRVKERGIGEARTLASAFNDMAESLQHSRDELETQNAELETQQGEMELTVEELAEERDRIQGFHDFVSRLSAQNQIDDLGETLIEELSAVANADAAILYAIEPSIPDDTDDLRLVAARGFDTAELSPRIERGQGLAGRALVEEGIVTADHGESGLELPGFAGNARLRHELHLPIGRPSGMIGVVSLAKLSEEGFTAHQCERLMELAGSAGVALANALTLEHSDRVGALNQSILESAQDAYVAVDDDGVVLAWNHTAEGLYGISAQEALGHRVAELVLPGDPEAQKSHDERRRGILAAADKGSAVERYPVWARRADGSQVHVEVSAAAVRTSGGSVVTYFSRDITEHTLREQESAADDAVSRALAEQGGGEEAIESILAAMGDNLDWPVGGFWEYNEHEHEVRCSRIRVAPGFEFPELAEFSRQIVYVPGEELTDFPALKRAWDSQSPVWEVLEPAELSERQQTARSTGLRAAVALPVMSGGRMLGVLTFGARAIGEPDEHRWLRLRSITNLIGQVMERTTARQEADRLKNEFFALVSHELRTPLTSITGYLEIVRAGDAGEINEDQRHYLNVIDRNARRLYRLVSDLLFIAQVEAGRMPTNRKSMLNLEEIATEAVDAARPQADKKGVLLNVEAKPVSTAGDGERLGQLIDNLISNALKFTPEGGRVSVRVSNGGPTATIEVSDTGMGISPEDQEKLFERFYRTTDVEKLALPGLGLGLSICKAIAESHGGSISVSSTQGHGTTFTVELPISTTVTEPDVIIAKSNGHEKRGALPRPPAHSG
jgi:PAS domain S-box-containing protein